MTLTKNKMPLIFAGFLAAALQIQVTLFSTETYAGLRVGLGDFLLPLVGLYVLFTLVTKKSDWPKWWLKHAMLWIGGLTIIMTISVIHGYYTNGFLSHWGFFNKYVGFIILACYFLLGGWMVTNDKNIAPFFLRNFIMFYLGVLIVAFIDVLVQPFVSIKLWLGMFFWDGFMVNRNAYMVLTLFVMVLMEAVRNDKNVNLPVWIAPLFWFLMPTFALYNASRAGWIAAGIILPALLVLRPRITIKKILPFLLTGSFIAWLILQNLSFGEVRENRQFRHFMNLANIDAVAQLQDAADSDSEFSKNPNKEMYGGDKKRFIAVQDGLKLYKQSNPIIGAGLGVYPEFQKKERGEFIDIIDFTALWLLVETGPLGALAFGGFFLACMYTLFKTARGQHSDFHKGMFCFLIIFAGVSLLHEIMYMRFVWFALGLALAMPKQDTNEKTES